MYDLETRFGSNPSKNVTRTEQNAAESTSKNGGQNISSKSISTAEFFSQAHEESPFLAHVESLSQTYAESLLPAQIESVSQSHVESLFPANIESLSQAHTESSFPAHVESLSQADVVFLAQADAEVLTACDSDGNLIIVEMTEGVKENTITVGTDGQKKKRSTPKKLRRQRLRQAGKPYKNTKGEDIAGRQIGAGCGATCKKQCHTKFPLEERKRIFASFWDISVMQRKDFVLRHIQVFAKRRTTTQAGDDSRRRSTRVYTLPTFDKEEKEVCKVFFLATLDVGAKFLRYAESHSNVIGTAKVDKRGKGTPKNKTPPNSVKTIRMFIEKLPAVRSHYCRSSSVKKYLPEDWLNLTEVHRRYKLYCESKGLKPVSKFVFNRIWHRDYNIGFHKPKKDKCHLCIKFQSLSEPTEEERNKHEAHLAEKDAVNARYAADQARAKTDSSFVCCSFDLQKVLICPHGSSSLFYYSRKYAFYNFTFYESHTQNVFCNTWSESDGKRGPNEIASCLEKYLRELDGRNIKDVALYCDNCPGQQKNKFVVSAIAYVASKLKHVRTISLNFLVAGHTHMVVDSVHAVIEQFSQKKTICSPSEWRTIISNARHNPFPYTVLQWTYKDWRDYKVFCQYENPLPIQTRNQKEVNQERRAFNKNKKKEEKIRLESFLIKRVQRFEFEKRNVRNEIKFFETADQNNPDVLEFNPTRRKNLMSEPTQLYFQPLPISEAKYNDLINVCKKGAIPNYLHNEFLNLPHDVSTADCLPQTDDEDQIDSDEEDGAI